MIPSWSKVALVWAVCILLALGVVWLALWQIDKDDQTEAVCTNLGGYVVDDLCRDRKTDAVLATWSELEDVAHG